MIASVLNKEDQTHPIVINILPILDFPIEHSPSQSHLSFPPAFFPITKSSNWALFDHNRSMNSLKVACKSFLSCLLIIPKFHVLSIPNLRFQSLTNYSNCSSISVPYRSNQIEKCRVSTRAVQNRKQSIRCNSTLNTNNPPSHDFPLVSILEDSLNQKCCIHIL